MIENRERKQKVVLSNEAARNANFDLTTQQLTLLLYVISKIKPDDDCDTWYSFDLLDMAECCGLKMSASGTYYKRLKADLLKMAARRWEPVEKDDPAHLGMTSWIGDADVHERSGYVRVRFNPYVADFLFDQKRNYTMFDLENVLTFTSKYSIRLYIILKSYMNMDVPVEFRRETLQWKLRSSDEERPIKFNDDERTPTEEELKILNTEWRNFKPKILDRAIQEINEKSNDMHVEVEYKKSTRSHVVTHVRFVITRPGIAQKNSARIAREALFQA